MARHAICATAAALFLASSGAPSAAERGFDPASIERSVARAERVDRTLGRHAALPILDQQNAAGSVLVVPPFPPGWLYGQPFSQQPFFANRPLLPAGNTGK